MVSSIAAVETDAEAGSRFRAANGPAFALLGLAVLLGLLAGWVAWGASVEVDRNREFAIRLERLISAMKDMETGQRGFLLTGNDAYLEPYRSGGPIVDRQLSALEQLELPLGNLPDLVKDRRASLGRGIDVYRTSGAAAAIGLVQQGRGKSLMDALKTTVDAGEDEADDRISAQRRHEAVVAAPLALASMLGLGAAFTLLIGSTIRRRRAQQASAALLEGVLENAPIGLGFLDRSLHVRRLNQALKAISHPFNVKDGGLDVWRVLPQMRDALIGPLQDLVAGGRPVHNLEVTAPTADPEGGTRSYQVSLYALPSVAQSAGAESGGVGMVVADVTARKLSEKRMRESEERFRTLTESVSSMVWITDGSGHFVSPQPEWAAFTGQTFEIYRERGWRAAVHPDDAVTTEDAWRSAVVTLSPYRIEHRLRRHDGAWRYVAAAAVPIVDEAGQVREWVGSHTDITERKEAEMELAAAKTAAESANRAKSVFLANMSHELRTPLSAVIGYSEMMEEEVEDLGIESLSADLGKIKSNARHLLSLINDVLDLSKIEANRMDVFAETVEVEPLLADVASTVESLVAKKENALEYRPVADLGHMRTDAVKLRQCLFNLLSNAAKFTERGRITLSATRLMRPDGDWFEFRVGDTGIGMSSDQVDRLFQRFSQADETTTRKFGGTGLGLAITRAFCRLLGGDIRVESAAGVGTTFIMSLPAVLPDPKVQPEPRLAVTAAAHARAREVVLIIDDDAAQRDIVARFLERQGFATRTAPDGQAGLDLARDLKPRAILLDVMMPHMDGWSVLTALKNDPELATIPVVMVTFVQDTGMGASLGAADYLTKPVHWDKLKAVMDRFRAAEGDVLIVDDDADARARLKAVLERNGWTTQEAANGRDALDLVVRSVPRVILLDLTMPVMDGFSFLAELRGRPGCGDLPVIVLTARDLTTDDRRRLEGADRVFSKGGGEPVGHHPRAACRRAPRQRAGTGQEPSA